MKIDPRAESTREVAPVAPDTASPPSKAPEKQVQDDVTLSGELRLADQAVRAAAITGDVRPQNVERARQLLQQGRLASDIDGLAERIIDSLIQSRGHTY